MLLLISIGISQEAKIDSVAIMAAMEIEFNKINRANEQIKQWQINKDRAAYAYNGFARMLVPKVEEEPIVEEDEKKDE